MPFNRNFAKTDAPALREMISSQDNVGGTAQDLFYPRQKKGSSPTRNLDEESKQPRAGDRDVGQMNIVVGGST